MMFIFSDTYLGVIFYRKLAVFLEPCVKACECMCDEALFAQCLPGSWTAVPEVKLAVVSVSLSYTHLLGLRNTNSAKRQNGCKPLPISRFAFLPLGISEKCFWLIHCMRICFYQQLFLVPSLTINEPLSASSLFLHPNDHLIFTQKYFWGYTKE